MVRAAELSVGEARVRPARPDDRIEALARKLQAGEEHQEGTDLREAGQPAVLLQRGEARF
jgi:hypothetical protein